MAAHSRALFLGHPVYRFAFVSALLLTIFSIKLCIISPFHNHIHIHILLYFHHHHHHHHHHRHHHYYYHQSLYVFVCICFMLIRTHTVCKNFYIILQLFLAIHCIYLCCVSLPNYNDHHQANP